MNVTFHPFASLKSPTLRYGGESASFILSKVQQLSKNVNKKRKLLLNSRNPKQPQTDFVTVKQAVLAKSEGGKQNKMQTQNSGTFVYARYSAVKSTRRTVRSEDFPELRSLC